MCLAALCAGTFAGSAQNKFTIEGTIIGKDSGQLVVIADAPGGRVDTLAKTDFTDGKFLLEGTVTEPMAANVVLVGYQGGFFVLAEPGGKYQALLVNSPEAKLGGTKLMDTWEEYLKLVHSFNNAAPAMEKQIQEYRKANKFKSASELGDKLLALREESARNVNAFLAQHDGLIPAYIAYVRAFQESDIAKVKEIYASLGEKSKASASGRLIADRIARIEGAEAGNIAPDFTLNDIQDRPVKMSEVKAKLKIIDFWASWCGPCRMNNPDVKQLYDDYKDKGLEIIGVSLDEKKPNWLAAVTKDGLEWINVCSLKGWRCEVAKAYGVEAVPALFVLDENNRIIATGLRGSSLREFVAGKLGQ